MPNRPRAALTPPRPLRAPAALLLVAALLYLGTPTEILLGRPLDSGSSYLSELAARDQDLGWLFRLIDGAVGLLAMVVTLLLWRRVPRRGTWWRDLGLLAVLGLGIFGFGTFADVVFPMECAPSATPECAAAEAAGDLDLIHEIHVVASVIALTGSVVLVAALMLACLHRSALGVPARVGYLVLGAAFLVAMGVIGAAALDAESGGVLAPGAGWAQRIQTALLSAHLVLAVPLLSRLRPGLPGAPAPG